MPEKNLDFILDLEDKSVTHPVLGAMSVKQMIEFVGLHEKRHIGQIREIKQSILNQRDTNRNR